MLFLLLQKGCRVQAHTLGKSVTSITSRPSIGKITRDPCLLATFEASDELGLFRIIDDFGTIVPFKTFSSGTGANLKCAILAPILSCRYEHMIFCEFINWHSAIFPQYSGKMKNLL